ncbi:hypothetical protein WHR41_04030 [Cladosporium halotolerans]|uniref:Amino acid transporter transmembrane domain-containing protein n=1 Tax=Cladosporium halotolerans TaxID=1052096 RepID=A0AB34KT56_9PEZI
MEMNPKVNDAAEHGDLEQTMTGAPSQPGDVQNVQMSDDVFGEVGEDGPNYRNVGWIAAAVLMLKSQIGIGVLSIPTAFDVLGMIPGIICLLFIASVATWSGFIVGPFKLRHPSVYGLDDAGMMIAGPIAREMMAGGFTLYWIFLSGSGMLGVSIGLNALSTHGACTAIFVAVAAAIGFIFASVRTLGRLSWLAWVGTACVLVSVFVLTVAAGVQERPAAAPQTGPWESNWKIAANPTFEEAMAAVSSLVLAYAGVPAFFAVASEMADPKLYTRSVLSCQLVATVTYSIIGIVVYYYCGSFVASPALGSAGVLMKKVCYGLVLPGLIVSTLLYIHLTAKYFMVRILRGSKHLAANTWQHWTTWLCCTGGITIIAYCIASGIPVFESLVSLVGALFGTFMTFQPMGAMWFYDNWNKVERDWKWKLRVCWAAFVIVIGTFLMIGGTYGSVVGIIDSYSAEGGGSGAWSCADNSNSV